MTLPRIPAADPAASGATGVAPPGGPTGGHPGASSRAPEHAEATCQAVTGPSTPTPPNRSLSATVAAPRAASRSRHGQPNAVGTGRSTPARAATASRCTRTASNRVAAARNQPRTVDAGTPSSDPIGRCPDPAARATSAAPITLTAYARRDSTVTGSSTCVTPQPGHRARRGRNRPGKPRGPRGSVPTPRAQCRRAVRAPDAPAAQPRLDPNLISLYRYQRCLRASSTALPQRLPTDNYSGRAVVVISRPSILPINGTVTTPTTTTSHEQDTEKSSATPTTNPQPHVVSQTDAQHVGGRTGRDWSRSSRPHVEYRCAPTGSWGSFSSAAQRVGGGTCYLAPGSARDAAPVLQQHTWRLRPLRAGPEVCYRRKLLGAYDQTSIPHM